MEGVKMRLSPDAKRRADEIRSRAKPVPESKRKFLEQSSEAYAKYGFTVSDAMAQNIIIPEKRLSRYGNDRITGYRAANAPDTVEVTSGVRAIDDYFRRYKRPAQLRSLSEMSREEALQLANEVVTEREIERRRRSAIRRDLNEGKQVAKEYIQDYAGEAWADEVLAKMEDRKEN